MIYILCSNAREKDGTVAEKLQQILFGSESVTRKLFKDYLKETFPLAKNKIDLSQDSQVASIASTSKENEVSGSTEEPNEESSVTKDHELDSSSVRHPSIAPVDILDSTATKDHELDSASVRHPSIAPADTLDSTEQDNEEYSSFSHFGEDSATSSKTGEVVEIEADSDDDVQAPITNNVEVFIDKGKGSREGCES